MISTFSPLISWGRENVGFSTTATTPSLEEPIYRQDIQTDRQNHLTENHQTKIQARDFIDIASHGDDQYFDKLTLVNLSL